MWFSKVVFERSGKEEGLFHFKALSKGTYTFTVSNNKWMEAKQITFALGVGSFNTLKLDHVESVDEAVQSVENMLKDIQTESTYLWVR